MSEDQHPSDDLQSTRPAEPVDTHVPERIGPYRILQKLGEGGMGEVYEAQQEGPVHRRVALKVVKLGMDSRQVIARFESERQALAMMSHPVVAQVFDAGTTERGRPYFAMERVRGERITDYCDRHRVGTRERLELFMRVCDGVQHAHHKGIIHRDLKPSNIMVAIEDDHPVPKIIDFGVAKAIERRLTEKTVFTEMGVLIGTPEYMSPEQAEMTGLDIDTRTDVYSLGVVLYELLAGALPFDSQKLRGSDFDELRRMIRESEPSKPSTRVGTLDEAATNAAVHRGTDLPVLRRQLRGDLDWIVMKALEKDRTRRYASPNELAADIRRHLRNEPVQASPPNTAYRVKKFVSRHRIGVAATSVVALALVAGIVGTTVGLVRANRARAEARREAATARQVSDFLVGLFEVSDPSEARGKTVTAKEILDSGAHDIEQALDDQPVVRARLMNTIGQVYRKLGLYGEAEPLLEAAIATRRRVLGEDHPETLDSMFSLATLYTDEGRYDEAETLGVATLEARERTLGIDAPATLSAMSNLANLYRTQGRFDDAEPLLLRSLESRRRTLGNDHPATLGSMNNLASLYFSQSRYDEAESLFAQTLEASQRLLGETHPDTLDAMNNLASTYRVLGRYDEAEPLFVRTLQLRRLVLGKDHPATLASMNNLANLHLFRGRRDKAESLFALTLEARKRVLGEDHPKTLASMNNLANIYAGQGRDDEAEPLLLDAARLQRLKLGDEHPETLNSLNNLAALQLRAGRYREAETLLLEVIEIRRRVLGNDHPATAASLHYLACLRRDTGSHDEARALFEETQRILEDKLAPDHRRIVGNLREHAKLLRSLGEEEQALRLEARADGLRR